MVTRIGPRKFGITVVEHSPSTLRLRGRQGTMFLLKSEVDSLIEALGPYKSPSAVEDPPTEGTIGQEPWAEKDLTPETPPESTETRTKAHEESNG